jgi:hypothetical protein
MDQNNLKPLAQAVLWMDKGRSLRAGPQGV